MKYFYDLYNNSNRQQLVDDSETQICQQAVDDSIFMIPWGHHIQIINKCKGNLDKALFFVKKTYENNWSRAVLLNFLDTNLYEREGKAIVDRNFQSFPIMVIILIFVYCQNLFTIMTEKKIA